MYNTIMNRQNIEDNFYDAFEYFNKTLFSGSLPVCFITIREAPSSLGYYSEKRFSNGKTKKDEIALNARYFNTRTIDETFSTLVHEMCHLWQFHFGTPGRGRYHNKEWAAKMECLGLIPTSSGIIGEENKKTGDHVTHAIDPKGLFRKACDEYLNGNKIDQWYDVFTENCFSVTRYNFDNEYKKKIQETLGSTEQFVEQVKDPEKKQTRVRYSCSCPKENHVWGRPGLRIKCLDCDEVFLENEI
jgi:predicted SprT family Zn-dependent metalloprotease